jgi:hypothetical protein
MRKAFLLTFFSIIAPIIMVISVSLLYSSLTQKNSLVALNGNPKVAFAALPAASGTFKVSIVQKDARKTIVKEFFKKYKSDLLAYSDEVVDSADKYGLDYRLIPAIAMEESTGCRNAPKNSYNCWGFGIYGKKVTKFDNYSQAIDTVTKTLANQYKANGLETPEQIMTRYTPGSNGSWAKGVTNFMNQLAISL